MGDRPQGFVSTFNTQGQALNFFEDTAKINAFENFERPEYGLSRPLGSSPREFGNGPDQFKISSNKKFNINHAVLNQSPVNIV